MRKNRIHSVLTALPPLMLMVGLFVYYRGEQAQLAGPLILEEGVTWEGHYKGTSMLSSLGDEQLFFWLDTTERARGARITPSQMQRIKNMSEPLMAGQAVSVQVAPRVAGSTTYWLLTVEREGELIDWR